MKAQRAAIRAKKLYAEQIIPDSQMDDAVMARDVAMADEQD